MADTSGGAMKRGVATLARSATVVLGMVMASTGMLVATAEDAHAATCYGGAQHFIKKDRVHDIPTGSGWWKTTSRCNDINLQKSYKQPGSTHPPATAVMVCFRTTGCQSSWTKIPESGTWFTVATNVKDGTDYRFRFNTMAPFAGSRAN